MISREEILMSRDKEYPLDESLEANLKALLEALNKFREIYGHPMYVSSGYRPGHYNKDAGGAPLSAHALCMACDFKDTGEDLDTYCTDHIDVLEKCGLYLESPDHTPGWCHLTIRPTKSGKRIFIP